MPEWVIVAESTDGVPIVLAGWVMDEHWIRADAARQRAAAPAIFATRWGAKRTIRRLSKTVTPRAIRYDRL